MERTRGLGTTPKTFIVLLEKLIESCYSYVTDILFLPKVKASALMALGLCCTFLGYEYSRVASIILLSSDDLKLGNFTLPATVAVGGPLSALILYMYTNSISTNGTRVTFRISCLACLIIFLMTTLFCNDGNICLDKVLIIVFYAFREVYVSLLSSQQWAFVSTTLDKSTTGYLVSFGGFVSIASALGSCSVDWLVHVGGVRILLVLASTSILILWVLGEYAMSLIKPKELVSESFSSEPSALNKKSSFWSDSYRMITSNNILRLLFLEAISHQICVNMLQLMFHNSLSEWKMNKNNRAIFVGNVFAAINIASSVSRMIIMPLCLNHDSLPWLLKLLPCFVLIGLLVGIIYPSAITSCLGFGIMKTIEYSFLHAASEIIYMQLGRELRYVGKELIKFFGHKIGKIVASVLLGLVFGYWNVSIYYQSLIAIVFTAVWASSLYGISNHLLRQTIQDGQDYKLQHNSLRQSRSNLSLAMSEQSEDEAIDEEVKEIIFFRHSNEDENISNSDNTSSSLGYMIGEGQDVDIEPSATQADIMKDLDAEGCMNNHIGENKKLKKNVSFSLDTKQSTESLNSGLSVSAISESLASYWRAYWAQYSIGKYFSFVFPGRSWKNRHSRFNIFNVGISHVNLDTLVSLFDDNSRKKIQHGKHRKEE